ncbi:hypothetical protein [Streptomyces sp. NPDC001714]|uniref:hypothetical protein n=1 Tax=Streptomyces sp. NPDC001714 TaxID=3364603 RepID=UPI0036C52E21
MSVRQAAVPGLRSGRVRVALGLSVVGATLALGAAATAHATASAPVEPQKEHATYTSGAQTPGESSETDVPADAKPAQTAPPCPGGLDACDADAVHVTTPAR